MVDGKSHAALVMERLKLRKVSELHPMLVINTMTAFFTAASTAARVAMLVAVLMTATAAMTVAAVVVSAF